MGERAIGPRVWMVAKGHLRGGGGECIEGLSGVLFAGSQSILYTLTLLISGICFHGQQHQAHKHRVHRSSQSSIFAFSLRSSEGYLVKLDHEQVFNGWKMASL
jgi:hypothetical protein